MKKQLAQELEQHLKQMYEQLEIYTGQYAELDTKGNGILRAIGRIENPRVSDVARELSISMSTASWCIDSLEKKNFLKRHRSEDDRRAVFLTLTPKGKKVVRQFDGMFERIAGAASDGMTLKEMESLVGMLKKIDIGRE